MQLGGYPLDKNDLTGVEWIDLGRLKQAMEADTRCPAMPAGDQ